MLSKKSNTAGISNKQIVRHYIKNARLVLLEFLLTKYAALFETKENINIVGHVLTCNI